MKPIKLEIEGFFSYTTRQEVDFQRLWEAGFFGLIGETGAGKSALVEAILIALYADSARSGRSPKNLINPLSAHKTSYIQLTFEHKGEIYIARYEVRKGKAFHVLYLPTGESKVGEDVPKYITHKLLGLSYDDFTLAFVLQQGQFDAFLVKTPKERSVILRGILRLPLDGLSEQASHLLRSTESMLNPIENQIEQLEEQLRENDPKKLRKEYRKTRRKIRKIKTRIQNVDKLLVEQETFKSYAEQYQYLQAKYQEMERQKPAYEEREAEIKKIENVKLSSLSSLYAQEKGVRQRIEKLRAQIKQYDLDIQSYRKKIAELQPKLEEIRPDYEQRDWLRRRREALQKLTDYWRVKRELENLRGRIQRGEELIREKKEKIEELESQIKKTEEKRKPLQEKLQRLPTELLQWYAAHENVSRAYRRAEEHLKTKIDVLQAARAKAENELTSILQKAEISQPLPEDWEAWKSFLTQVEEELRKKIDRLKYEQLAATLAASLEPGQACPVCGSTEHPKKAHPEPAFEKRIKASDEVLKAIQKFRGSTFDEVIKRDLEHREAIKALHTAQEDLERHRASFKSEWAAWGHSPDASLPQLNAERQELEKEQKALEDDIDEMRKEIDKNRKDLEKYEELLEKIKDEYQRKVQEINLMEGSLSEVLTKAELQLSGDDAAKEVQALDKRLEVIESFEKWEQELREAQTRIRVSEEEKQKKERELDEENQALSKLREDEAQEAHRLVISLEEALRYLEYPEEELRKEKDEIKAFFSEMESTLSTIEEIRPKAQSFDERIYSDKKAEKSRLEKEMVEYARLQGELRSRLSQAQKDKERLKQLRGEAKALRERLEGLEVINHLLRAEGFIQYVLSKMLWRLVKPASKYLSRWSRGQLELVAREGELDLMVQDHWAGEHWREIRTLSGGQRFQAALALALALSDLVQYHSGATEHLSGLIIDEGFGTLDTETLHIVVQTLREIAMEGRPIGIITHRTEIQSMLPAYVRVERRGQSSVVFYS